MDLGEKIRRLRKQAGLNLQGLSQKSGIGLGTLSRLENGKVMANVRTHAKLCEALGISLAELYREVETNGEGLTPLEPTSEEVETFTYDEKAQSILLARQVLRKHMLPQLLILQPGGQTHQERAGLGTEKWLFVLEGVVEVAIGEESRHLLKRHGTLYFKASSTHQVKNQGKTVAKCISVTSPVRL